MLPAGPICTQFKGGAYHVDRREHGSGEVRAVYRIYHPSNFQRINQFDVGHGGLQRDGRVLGQHTLAVSCSERAGILVSYIMTEGRMRVGDMMQQQ